MGELAHKQLIYSEPQAEILETTAERVLFQAGVGSGKSQVIGVRSMDFILNNPEVRGFIGANTYSQLTKATMDRVKNVWANDFGIIEDTHYVVNKIPPENFLKYGSALNSYENTISFQNGALVFLASLENYKVIDGTEFGWAMLDETKDTREEAVKEVIIQRLRQKGMYINPVTRAISKTKKPGYLGYNPLFIFTSPAKTQWLTEWFNITDYADEIQATIFNKDDYFRKNTGRQFIVISSTYHNAPNLPPGYIENMIKDLSHNPGLIDMLIYGSPFGKTGGEFVTTYNRLEHVKVFEPWPDEPVHLSFDFNYVPYMTCICFQIKYIEATQRYKVRFFDEFCLPNPKNNCEALSKEIIYKYEKLLRNGLYYYGDYSGKSGTVLVAEFKNHYQVIEKYLQPYLSNSSDRVIVNQSLTKRRAFICKLLKGDYPVDIEIHQQCKELNADFEFCKEGPDGGKLKEMGLVNGVRCQTRGHTLDAFEYGMTSGFNTLFNS